MFRHPRLGLRYSFTSAVILALLGALLVYCGGGSTFVPGTATYPVSGIVSGLTSGGLILQNNGVDDLAVPGDGTFTFGTRIADGTGYNVTIISMPNDPAITCAVINGTGTVPGKAVDRVLVVCHPVAGAAVSGIEQDVMEDMASSPLTGWATVLSPVATRSGVRIQSIGGMLYYTRNDFVFTTTQPFQFEAVVDAEAMFPDGERGAGIRVSFPTSLSAPGENCTAEIRLVRELGTNVVKLFDYNQGVALAALAVDWANVGNPLRIRLKRQRVIGFDYIFLQVESAATFDDPAFPNNLNDPPRSVGIQQSSFIFAPVFLENVIAFGNIVSGTYFSDWTSVRMTTAADGTVLPYWPATPPAPTLVYDDKGSSGPAVVAYADLGSPPMSMPYLATDVVTLSLIHSGGTNTVSITDPSIANDGLQHLIATALAGGQTVSAYVTVCDISGRCSTGPTATVAIP